MIVIARGRAHLHEELRGDGAHGSLDLGSSIWHIV
jgi:hypothetical protein